MKKSDISRMEKFNSSLVALIIAVLLPLGSMMAQDKIVGKLIKNDTLFTQPSSKSQGIGILPVDGNVTVLSQNNYGWSRVKFITYENGKDKEYIGWIHTRSIKTKVIEDMKKYPHVDNPNTGEHREIGCENITPRYDSEYNFELTINAINSELDVVLKLCDKRTDECIRMIFVNAGSTYTLRNIPEGEYYFKQGTGKDLRKRTDKNGNCLIVFAEHGIYQKSVTSFEFRRVYTSKYTYSDSAWEYILEAKKNEDGNVVLTNEISLDEFNE